MAQSKRSAKNAPSRKKSKKNYAPVKKGGGKGKKAGGGMTAKLKKGSKAAGRRKSFCARSKSWKSERGLAARRKWNC